LEIKLEVRKAFRVRIYIYLAKSWAVFNVFCAHRCQKFKLASVTLFFLPSSLWASFYVPLLTVHLAALSTVIQFLHCGLLGLLVRCGEKITFYKLLIKYWSSHGMWLPQVSLQCYTLSTSPLPDHYSLPWLLCFQSIYGKLLPLLLSFVPMWDRRAGGSCCMNYFPLARIRLKFLFPYE
jgi:hypothetical protein